MPRRMLNLNQDHHSIKSYHIVINVYVLKRIKLKLLWNFTEKQTTILPEIVEY